MNEIEVSASSSIRIHNMSGLSDDLVSQTPQVRELANQLTNWVNNARAATGSSSMFNRGAFTPPEHHYAEMAAAKVALLYDDVVSAVAEITEAYAFTGTKWESENLDDCDIYNQISADIDLDSVIRKMWREEFAYSQVVVASRWDWREYTLRGNSIVPQEKKIDPATGAVTWVEQRDPITNERKKGPKRRQKYKIWCPVEVRILDGSKIVPVGVGPFAGDRLAWMATVDEILNFHRVYSGETVDLEVLRFYTGVYKPDQGERMDLAAMGINPDRLLLVNPDFVFRHTTTKPDYQRFADIRMKSCFPLLDMKRQLLTADRAALIGAANYILLVRKGSKEEPASNEEINNLKENYNFIAKVPVIISDHRLSIEIIAPKTDLTLSKEKYDVIDHRLLNRLLGTLRIDPGKETGSTLSGTVGRIMENRRHMIRRAIEREIGRKIYEDDRNADKFDQQPSLVFTPGKISLGFDAAEVQALLGLRTQREISRETILEFFGLDEANEAKRMELEERVYDQIFKTAIPFSSPTGVPPASTGQDGGRPTGGGEPTKNATTAPAKTASGNTTKGSK